MRSRDTEHPRPVLNRRTFLSTTLTAGAMGALFPSITLGKSCEASLSQMPALPQPSSSELEELTIDRMQRRMASGEETAVSLLEQYVERIDGIDRSGPSLRSILELNPDAEAIAEALDSERRSKGPRGPLHGIPILLKDNIDTADRMATTAGSLALVGSTPVADAFLVEQLRRAGALILGKTNLSEWANIRSSRSTSGWSARGGLTKNPYALDRNTSGSSSGSAAAVAASLCAAAVGTETDGSIVSPSSINGLVGVKPTVGLMSRTGIIPISHTQDTAGPMARTVRDAAILLSAMTGYDSSDPATLPSRRFEGREYTTELTAEALSGARIGVVRNSFGFHRDVDDVINRALGVLRDQGAVLVDPAPVDTIGMFENDEFTVLLYELKADMRAYLSSRRPDAAMQSLRDLITFNEENALTEMPWFGQETFYKAEAKGPLTRKEYRDALQRCRRLTREKGIDAVMKKHRLDALVAPTDGPAWLTDLVTGDHFIGGSSSLAAVAGYPSVTVPAGRVFGLPVGISFFGRAWSEPRLLALAYAFEQATHHRTPPRFLPTVDLRLPGAIE